MASSILLVIINTLQLYLIAKKLANIEIIIVFPCPVSIWEIFPLEFDLFIKSNKDNICDSLILIDSISYNFFIKNIIRKISSLFSLKILKNSSEFLSLFILRILTI